MIEIFLSFIDTLIYIPEEGMVHPGLPAAWVAFVFSAMFLIGVRYAFFYRKNSSDSTPFKFPFLTKLTKPFITKPWLLVAIRLFASAVFLTVIYAGLFGTAIPEKNIATVLTWTIWWSGVIISIFFVGSAWCAICPWDAIATWLVRQRLWKKARATSSLNIRVPSKSICNCINGFVYGDCSNNFFSCI